MNRREVLATTGIALSTVLGGCLTGSSENPDQSSSTSTGTSDQSLSIQTPSEGECEPTARLRPTPDSSRTKQYPTIPESLTTSTAKSFVTTSEQAYQYNSKLPEYEDIAVDLKVPEWAISQTQRGYTVGLDVRVQFDNTETSTASSTPLPSGFFELSVWYYLTDRFALRGDPTNEGLQRGGTPNFDDADTIACDTTDTT